MIVFIKIFYLFLFDAVSRHYRPAELHVTSSIRSSRLLRHTAEAELFNTTRHFNSLVTSRRRRTLLALLRAHNAPAALPSALIAIARLCKAKASAEAARLLQRMLRKRARGKRKQR
jgi:hypothetical protein